jgi:hypothetical protein
MIKTLFAVLAVGLIPLFSRAAGVEPPKEVSSFLKERESCDHWRGEGYDKDRRAEIGCSICQSCPGTDSKFVALKKKYQADKYIVEKLAELERKIEADDKGATQRFCRSLKKPKSLDDVQ